MKAQLAEAPSSLFQPSWPIEVRHLRLIEAVERTGSLTRAADELHLTQSALSHQLRELESRLKLPLFQRVGRRLVLSEAGRRLLETARRLLPGLVEAERELWRLANGELGELRVATGCYTCYHWLPPVLKDFRESFPEVSVRVVAELTHHPFAALRDGRLDVAIVSTLEKDRDLEATPLFDDELVVIAAADHRLASRSHIRASDLAREELLVHNARPDDSDLFLKVLRPAGVEPRKITEVLLTEAILEMVKAGLGVAVLARWAVAPHLDPDRLAALPLTRRGLGRTWYAVHLRQEPSPPHFVAFVELLVRKLGVFSPPDRLSMAGAKNS